jgi:hypothetical protein
VSSFDLFGWRSDDLDEVKVRVEEALGLMLEPHESGYLGGLYYRCGDPRGEELVLQRNLELEELMEDEFPDHLVLLYVSRTQRRDEIKSRIKSVGAELLRHADFPPVTAT